MICMNKIICVLKKDYLIAIRRNFFFMKREYIPKIASTKRINNFLSFVRNNIIRRRKIKYLIIDVKKLNYN